MLFISKQALPIGFMLSRRTPSSAAWTTEKQPQACQPVAAVGCLGAGWGIMTQSVQALSLNPNSEAYMQSRGAKVRGAWWASILWLCIDTFFLSNYLNLKAWEVVGFITAVLPGRLQGPDPWTGSRGLKQLRGQNCLEGASELCRKVPAPMSF